MWWKTSSMERFSLVLTIFLNKIRVIHTGDSPWLMLNPDFCLGVLCNLAMEGEGTGSAAGKQQHRSGMSAQLESQPGLIY